MSRCLPKALEFMKTNEDFIDELKDMSMDYVEFQMRSLKIPDVKEKQDWGPSRIAHRSLIATSHTRFRLLACGCGARASS